MKNYLQSLKYFCFFRFVTLLIFLFLNLSCSHLIHSKKTVLFDIFKPYQSSFFQGRFISKEQLEQIHIGMTSEEVRSLLGPPSLNFLHSDHWYYISFFVNRNQLIKKKQIMVHFENNTVKKIESDVLSTESKFLEEVENIFIEKTL